MGREPCPDEARVLLRQSRMSLMGIIKQRLPIIRFLVFDLVEWIAA